jgi:uncharacterized secreted protein with C-terminal beta-propeller domain
MQRTAVASLLAALALVACNPDAQFGDPPTRTDASLERFTSCGALERGFVDSFTEELVAWRYGYWYDVAMEDSDGAPADDSGSEGPSDYSTTNVQESGVDEPDIVKTNGNYTYVIDPSWYGNNSIHIVKTWPVEDAEEVGTVELEGYPYSMFLNGDRLVTYSYVYDLPTSDADPGRYGYGTRISIVDISDPSEPEEIRQIDLEGWLTDARMIDSDVYTVVNTYAYTPSSIYDLMNDPALPDNSNYWNLTEVEQAAVREEARRVWRPQVAEIVGGLDVETLLPRMWDHLPGEQVDAEPISTCTDVYHPDGVSRPSMLTVAHLAIDEDDGSELSTTTLMADGWQVYASQNALYIAQSSWWWWWGWGDIEQTTNIHKFVLEGSNSTYVASGSVDGWINDQVSFSEYDGYLRVATSDFWWWGCWGDACTEETEPPANNVFVLQESGAALNVVGEVTGIAPEEMIYATRFMGDKGYMVTFQQTDPLFTLDLSDPTDPEVVGELILPGYSSYLHPVDNDQLLAVGMAGDENGNIFGLKVTLFDVSNFNRPRIADELDLSTGDWSYSEALWDHHAFTYHRDNLSLPFYTYSWDDSAGTSEYFSGILSIDVDTELGRLTEVGRVSHQDLVDESVCLWDEYYESYYAEDQTFSYCDDEWYWYASVRRSVVIEDNLLSISDYGIKITDLADPDDEIARVLFYPNE